MNLIEQWMPRYEEIYAETGSDKSAIERIMLEAGVSEQTVCAWYAKWYYDEDPIDLDLW